MSINSWVISRPTSWRGVSIRAINCGITYKSIASHYNSSLSLFHTSGWIPSIPYTAHVTNADVRLRAGSPPQLLPLIQTRRLRFFGHVARMSDSQDTFRALHTSTHGRPEDWRRRTGRPRHTWLRTVNADLHPFNHGLNSAWRLAQDRGRWRQLVETATLRPGGSLVMMMMMSMITQRTSYKCKTMRAEPQCRHITLTAETRVNPDREHCTQTTHINYSSTVIIITIIIIIIY